MAGGPFLLILAAPVPAPDSGPDPAHVILTITEDGGAPLVTTAAPHGLLGGEFVVISGTSVVGYNGSAEVVAVPTATTFILNVGYIGDSTGGSWAPS